MEIRKVAYNVFDVFLGNQWDEWTRVKLTKNNIFVINGNKLNHNTLKYLFAVLFFNFPINYGQTFENTVECLQCM